MTQTLWKAQILFVMMNGYNSAKQSESMNKSIMLIFFGVSLNSLIIIIPVLDSIKQNRMDFFSLELIVAYLTISFIYSLVTLLYSNPNIVISPFFIQFGTAGFITFAMITYCIVHTIDILTVLPHFVILIAEFSLFIAVGYFLTVFLRKLIGMSNEGTEFCNETYRIKAEYGLIKNIIFDDEYFSKYKTNEFEKGISVSKKIFKSGEIRIMILLQSILKSPDESTLSISTCEIKFERIWKTGQAEKVLKTTKRMINGILSDSFSLKLTHDEKEESVSSRCDGLLLESMQSSLSGIAKTQRRSFFAILGLVVLGIFVTVLPSIQFLPEVKSDIEPIKQNIEISIFTWVTIAATITILLGSQVKEKISKYTK